jgi:hypothetical protein
VVPQSCDLTDDPLVRDDVRARLGLTHNSGPTFPVSPLSTSTQRPGMESKVRQKDTDQGDTRADFCPTSRKGFSVVVP